jgi:hypothetical protein
MITLLVLALSSSMMLAPAHGIASGHRRAAQAVLRLARGHGRAQARTAIAGRSRNITTAAHRRVDGRTRRPRLQESGALDGDLYGDSFFTTLRADLDHLDGIEDEERLAAMTELRQLFSVREDEVEGGGGSGTSLADMDDMMLLFKLRKELGTEDFNRIFDTSRIKGPDLDII